MKNARAQYKNTFLLNYIVVFIVKFLFFVGILINCITSFTTVPFDISPAPTLCTFSIVYPY